jgi:hypothetical protein
MMRWGMPPPPRTSAAAGHQYPQHPFATLAGLAETGKPVLVPANSFAEFSAVLIDSGYE